VVSKKHWAPTVSVEVGEVHQSGSGGWVVSGRLAPNGICPECGTPSRQRHGWRRRRIEDFPAQGPAVWIELRVCRWRCLNSDCRRRTFSDREAAVATPYARRTSRQAQLLGHMAHAAVGTPAERLLRRLVSGSATIPFSDSCYAQLKLFHHARGSSGSMIGVGESRRPTGQSSSTSSVARS
jgi:hypothetical protein